MIILLKYMPTIPVLNLIVLGHPPTKIVWLLNFRYVKLVVWCELGISKNGKIQKSKETLRSLETVARSSFEDTWAFFFLDRRVVSFGNLRWWFETNHWNFRVIISSRHLGLDRWVVSLGNLRCWFEKKSSQEVLQGISLQKKNMPPSQVK